MLSAYGYIIVSTLNVGSKDFAMPSRVLSARALLIKYGGKSNWNRGTRRESESSSLSNFSSGICVVSSFAFDDFGYNNEFSKVISNASASARLSSASANTC